jgi:hypothetical protein
VSQPPIKSSSGRARLDFELFACADREEARSASAHAILVKHCLQGTLGKPLGYAHNLAQDCASTLTFSEIA